MEMFYTHKGGLGNTSLGASEIDIVERVSLLEKKSKWWLILPSIETKDIYSLGASVANELSFF